MKFLQTLLLFVSSLVSWNLRAETYASYTNDRYGFSVSYPSGFRMDKAPENNDGRRLSNRDGATITVYGTNNVLEETVESLDSTLPENFTKVTYRAKGKNWLAMSGYKGDDILYIKAFVGTGSIDQLRIRHPEALAKKYSGATSRIVASFQPGDLSETH